jgi:5-methylcytosine-specific restriction endonuclease McrA
VSRHAACAGFVRDERAARRYDWRAVQAFYDAGHTIRECAAEFGFATSTFNDARRRGDIVARPRRAPLEVIFAAGVRRSRVHLKARLSDASLLPDKCEECGAGEWRGRPLVLQLHHLNGDSTDHRLENLALLCPNCHSQTDTWGGRNARRRAA